MQYSLLNNIKIQPSPKTKGFCPICGEPTIAKCGNRKVWHWAHVSKKHCDPWWENETEWHRRWKEEFPEECREIVHYDDKGEKHQADVKTNTGIIIEFQNSSISNEELKSRELFYKNMLWVVNGDNFKNNFHILGPLPDPESDFAKDIVFEPIKYNNVMRSHVKNKDFFGSYWKKSENPGYNTKENLLVEIYGMYTIENEIKANYRGHHHFDWVKPREVWLEAKCPVYIDFGTEFLWRLESHNLNLKCIRAVSRKKFIYDVNIETQSTLIASRFYPVMN